MNVTLKLQDSLGEKAKHCAVDAGTSLSRWVATLIEREVAMQSDREPSSLLEALGCEKFEMCDREDFEFSRGETLARELEF
ncbi:MAG: hypothetical protein ACSHYF_02325 [Verrucomicrobiaceae bacterium]